MITTRFATCRILRGVRTSCDAATNEFRNPFTLVPFPNSNLLTYNHVMSHTVLKHIHLLCIILSGSGFLARGIMMLTGSPWLQHKLVRVLPHIVDTALLASAVAMVALLGASALAMPWLIAKIVGLLVYIALGTIALKRGRSSGVRGTAFIAALLTFAYIVSVALSKNPLGFFAILGV